VRRKTLSLGNDKKCDEEIALGGGGEGKRLRFVWKGFPIMANIT
jgi:hypothetical protein